MKRIFLKKHKNKLIKNKEGNWMEYVYKVLDYNYYSDNVLYIPSTTDSSISIKYYYKYGGF